MVANVLESQNEDGISGTGSNVVNSEWSDLKLRNESFNPDMHSGKTSPDVV